MWAGRRHAVSFFLFPLVFFPALTAGCRNCDLVEAELRTREREFRELQDDLYRLESENAALHREVRGLRQGSPAATSPEHAAQTYTLKQMVLGRQTGGYDDDKCPGDEALLVVCEPRDGDGHAIKAPGILHVEALGISPEGLKTPLGAWDVSGDGLRRTWRSGLLSTGYHVILPWQNWPTTDRLRVVVRLELPDGRLFEADKDVTIRLTPTSQRKTPDSGVVPEPIGPPRKTSQGAPAERPRPPAAPEKAEAVERTSQWNAPTAPPLSGAVRLLQPVPLRPLYLDSWQR